MAKIGRNEPCPCGSGRKFKRCHGGAPASYSATLSESKKVVVVPKHEGYLVRQVGKSILIIPRAESELRVRVGAEKHLRPLFKPGTYVGDEANKVIQAMFGYYEECCGRAVKTMACRELLDLLLDQHDQWAALQRRDSGVSASDERYVLRVPAVLRALRYSIERIAESDFVDRVPSDRNERVALVEDLLIASEEMAKLAMTSEAAFRLFKRTVSVTVLEPGSDELFQVLYGGDFDRLVHEFVTRGQKEYFESGLKLFKDYYHDQEIDVPAYQACLDPAFKEAFGADVMSSLALLKSMIVNAAPAPGELGVLYIPEKKIVDVGEKQWKVPAEGARKLISGMTLSKESLRREPRLIWKPQQRHRLLFRPFISLDHEAGPHRLYAKSSAVYALYTVLEDLSYGKVPEEWRTPVMLEGVATLGRRLSREFEDVCLRGFRERGWQYLERVEEIVGEDKVRLRVDEIDAIAVSVDRMVVVVADAKRVSQRWEPALFKEDVFDFLTSDKPYDTVLLRKAEWVRDHLRQVIEHLNRLKGTSITPDGLIVYATLITRTPSFAQLLSERLPIRSLPVFFRDLDAVKGWPYGDLGRV